MVPNYFRRASEERAPITTTITYAEASDIAEEKSWTHEYHPFRGTQTKVGISQDVNGVSLRFYDSVYRYSRRLRYPIAQLCAGLVQYSLLRSGHLIVHGACLSKDGETGIALVGLSNAGKTTTTLRLVKENGFRFLSDDMFITDGKTALCFPRPLRLEHFADVPLVSAGAVARGKRALWTLGSSIPLLPEVWIHPYTADPTGPYDPLPKVELKRIFFLHRGRAGARANDLRDVKALRQLSIQHTIGTIDYDFAASRIFQMYAYESSDVDMISLREQQLELLRKLVGNCYCQQLNNDTPHFEALVLESLKQGA